MPPSIWPVTDNGLSARPTSWAVATWTTFTRPSCGSTSTTARWATNANAVWQLPWPYSSRSSVGGWRYSTVSSSSRPAVASPIDCRQPDTTSTTSVPVDGEPQCVEPVRRRHRLEQPLPHRSTRRVDRSPAHPRLPRRRGGSGRADLGVDAVEHDLVDAEDRPGDLTGDRDEPLTHLGRGELERRHTVGEPAPGRRVVVEPLGVHEVLDRHAPADAAHDVTGIGRPARHHPAAP